MFMKNGTEVVTYCALFHTLPVKNSSMFTLFALQNSNICLDGIQPVGCNCFCSTELVVLVGNIHEIDVIKSRILYSCHPTQSHDVISEPSF